MQLVSHPVSELHLRNAYVCVCVCVPIALGITHYSAVFVQSE